MTFSRLAARTRSAGLTVRFPNSLSGLRLCRARLAAGRFILRLLSSAPRELTPSNAMPSLICHETAKGCFTLGMFSEQHNRTAAAMPRGMGTDLCVVLVMR